MFGDRGGRKNDGMTTITNHDSRTDHHDELEEQMEWVAEPVAPGKYLVLTSKKLRGVLLLCGCSVASVSVVGVLCAQISRALCAGSSIEAVLSGELCRHFVTAGKKKLCDIATTTDNAS